MSNRFTIVIRKVEGREEVCDLLLTSSWDGTWHKRYFGNLFLLFDAQELGILQTDAGVHGSTRAALRTEAVLDDSMLRKLHFTRAEEAL